MGNSINIEIDKQYNYLDKYQRDFITTHCYDFINTYLKDNLKYGDGKHFILPNGCFHPIFIRKIVDKEEYICDYCYIGLFERINYLKYGLSIIKPHLVKSFYKFAYEKMKKEKLEEVKFRCKIDKNEVYKDDLCINHYQIKRQLDILLCKDISQIIINYL